MGMLSPVEGHIKSLSWEGDSSQVAALVLVWGWFLGVFSYLSFPAPAVS